MSEEKSFTLIELLVVIAIIGLISSVALVAIDLPGQRQKAKIAKTLEFSQSIQHAIGAEAVGIWNFDEGPENSSLISAKDMSGYGNDGTCSGGACPIYKSDTPQKIIGQNKGKYSLSFDGVNSFVTTKSFSLLSSNNTLTFNAWVNGKIMGQYQTLISDGSQSSAVGYIWGYRTTGSNQLAWQYAMGTNRFAFTSDSFFTNYDNQWIMVTIVVDYTNKNIKFYRNGALVNADSTTNTMLYPTANRVKYIGAYYSGAHYFSGLIDEVSIYTQALTIGQIQKYYTEGLGSHQNLAVK